METDPPNYLEPLPQSRLALQVSTYFNLLLFSKLLILGGLLTSLFINHTKITDKEVRCILILKEEKLLLALEFCLNYYYTNQPNFC